MFNPSPTDDELLSYIMNELSDPEKEAIERYLEISDKNRLRLKEILLLKKEIQKSPFRIKRKSSLTIGKFYALRGAALFFAFIAGLWIQSQWPFFPTSKKHSISQPPSISQPLSIETQHRGNIL